MKTKDDRQTGIPSKVRPPKDESELLQRARALGGLTLSTVAREHLMRVPDSPTRSKGWAGQLLERALGATAGSRAAPDFEAIGVEMKSLPVDRTGAPLESTYVCTVQLTGNTNTQWTNSWPCKKLSRVLWVPILCERAIPIPDRIIGTPFLWSPSDDESATLERDWTLLRNWILDGQIERITGSMGEALHIRPKAAKASDKAWAMGEEGEWVQVNPRGFYLRSRFTGAILQSNLALPASNSPTPG